MKELKNVKKTRNRSNGKRLKKINLSLLNHLPILSVVVIIISGMFIFNFDGYVFGLLKPENINNSVSSKINDKLITELKIQENNIEEKIIDKTPIENIIPVIIQDETQKEKDEIIKNKYSVDITILEKEKFYLEGNGEAWISSKNSFTPVEFNVELLPVKGTKLSKFDLADAEIKVRDKSYNFNQGTAAIQKSKFTLNIISDIEDSVFFSITGKVDFKIRDGIYNGKIKFDDEKFYIYEQGVGQLQLSDYTVTISSTPKI